MRRRIVVCLGVLLGLFLVGDLIALLCLDRSVRQLSALAEYHRIETLRAKLTSDAVRLEADLLARVAGHRRSSGGGVGDSERFTEALNQCASCHHQPAVEADLEGLGESFRAYQAARAQLWAAEAGAEREALESKALALASGLVGQTTRVDDRAARHLEVRSSDAAADIRNAWLALVGTLVAVLVFGGVVAFHLKRRLTQPVEALLAGIERVRAGDLRPHFTVEGDEEFRALAEALDRAYEDLKEAQERVLQAEKLAALGRLAAGVAHEVGNPLASISAIAQLMRRQCESNGQAERVDSLMEHVSRITRIVRDLLSFSRPPGEEQFSSVEIRSLLERATGLLAYDKRAQRVRIVHQFGDGPQVVRGDPDRLLLVFTNIMINAFDAMSEGADGVLTIITSAEQNMVAVRFQDNGPGMTDEQLANAFEPFFTTKEPGSGTGLGLWICYQVIQRHSATIRIDSSVGQGTTVTIQLPAASASGGAAPDPAGRQRAGLP